MNITTEQLAEALYEDDNAELASMGVILGLPSSWEDAEQGARDAYLENARRLEGRIAAKVARFAEHL